MSLENKSVTLRPREFLFIAISLFTLFLFGCGSKSDSAATASAVETAATDTSAVKKGLFSKWTPREGAIQLDLTAGKFSEVITLTVTGMPLSAGHLANLISAGRNTTGLTAGMTNSCTYNFIARGDDTSGTIDLDTLSDADTPNINACLEFDSFCKSSVGNLCNFQTSHTYTIEANVLTLDFFGSAHDWGIIKYD